MDDINEIARKLAEIHLSPSASQKLATILEAYDRALAEERTVIPTYLHAAIEAARPK